MNDIDEMTLKEKAAHYRAMAQEALLNAQAATDERARQSFLKLASGWHELATQFEESKLEDELSLKKHSGSQGG